MSDAAADNRRFDPAYQITNAVTAGLTKIERARGFLDAARLSDDWVTSMRSRALVLEAHHTTHIEGTHLTLDQSERLLAGDTLTDADPDDARELLNYREAFEFVSGYLDDGGPITEALIREIHARLVAGVRGGAGKPGEYRREQNCIVNSATGQIVYMPPPTGDVAALMSELVSWLNAETETHPVLVAGLAQFQLVHIHPFVDGNGRTSRLLSTLCLYRTGYDFKRLFSISEFYDRDRPAFYHAIQGVRDSGMDHTHWLEYFVQGLATQMDEVSERGKHAIRADVLGKEKGLHDRQIRLLRLVMMDHEVDIEACQSAFPATPRRTLQRDLHLLVQKTILKRHGATNQSRYTLIERVL